MTSEFIQLNDGRIVQVQALALDADAGEEWRTINGAHVMIGKGGTIEKGPHHLVGKTVAQVHEHGKADTKEKPGYHRIERDAVGNYKGTHSSEKGFHHDPEHEARLKNLKISPGYGKIHLAHDPSAMRQAYKTDSQGREGRVYSALHDEKRDAAKFARVKSFIKKLGSIREAIANHPSEEAATLRLIDQTGIRIGSDRDTGAKKKAYGASTLHSGHVVDDGGKTALHFVGKKGVDIHQVIDDPHLANELKDRASRGGKLYNTTADKVRDHLHSIAPGFKVKDFRTAVAADTALKAMKDFSAPSNPKEYEKFRKQVGERVAAKLGNTAAVALKSYIPPEVFSEWEEKANAGSKARTSQPGTLAASAERILPGRTYRPQGFSHSGNGLRPGRRGGGIYRSRFVELPEGRFVEVEPIALALSSDGEGHWITVHGGEDENGEGTGTHIFIKGGVITKGPPALTGKKLGELHKTGHRVTAIHGIHHPDVKKGKREEDGTFAEKHSVHTVDTAKKRYGSRDANTGKLVSRQTITAQVSGAGVQKPFQKMVSGKVNGQTGVEVHHNGKVIARVSMKPEETPDGPRYAVVTSKKRTLYKTFEEAHAAVHAHKPAGATVAPSGEGPASNSAAPGAAEEMDRNYSNPKRQAGFGGKSHSGPNPTEQGDTHGIGSGSGGSGQDAGGSEKAGAKVAADPRRSGDSKTDQERSDSNQPAGDGTARAVPAAIHRVNEKIDRVSRLLRSKGNNDVASWLDKLKDHVNAVGVNHALESLGEDRGGGSGAQYQGSMDISDFAEKYLSRAGIHLVGDDESEADPSQKVISSKSPSSGQFTRKKKGDFFPVNPKAAKNKLLEAQSLPGLEKSEALPKGTKQLTPAVMASLDKKYGKDKWIVKAYGDDAAAGFGIFFPQRARQIQQDAVSTIHSAGHEVAKYGFSMHRNNEGRVVGIRHENGDVYKFGSDAEGNPRNAKYASTINGHVREWADKAARAAGNEHGAMLPGGGKEFMAQPAFNVVGVSESERASGKTIAPGEGRVHVTTKNGNVAVVPHSTWIKGEHLPVVFENDDTRAMAKAAHEAISKLPASDRNGQIYAPDIVKTDQGYKVVEANPTNHTGGSGYLTDNPMIIDSYVSHHVGRDPAHVKFIRSLLSGPKSRKGRGALALSSRFIEIADGRIVEVFAA
jgi:DNA topoisomerase-1